MTVPPTVSIESILEVTDSNPPYHVLKFSKHLVSSFEFKGNLRRVICTLNNVETINCALFPSGANYFVTVSKALRKKLGVGPGDSVTIELRKDESKYGMPMPEEFEEVLRQDADGAELFYGLSPGNQRLMLKLVVFVKNVDTRIIRSLVGLEVLKQMDGRFDYHAQHEAMRAATTDRHLNRSDTNG